MRTRWRAWLAVAVVSGLAAPAFGWGPQAHRVITRIALERLSPKASAAIRDLLNPGDTLVEVCTWADQDAYDVEPDSGPWHYVNVPIDAPRYEDKFCGRKGECVVSQIKHFRKVLADAKAPRQDRRRALLFLVHFVEDIHQPLHVGDNRDRGGNLTQVRFFGDDGTNLHRVWDSGLMRHIGGNDRTWVDRVEPLITPDHVKTWSAGTVEDWANESLKAAKVAYLVPKGPKGPMPSGTTLGREYVEAAEPILREQMARAGVRLANELNAIFK